MCLYRKRGLEKFNRIAFEYILAELGKNNIDKGGIFFLVNQTGQI